MDRGAGSEAVMAARGGNRVCVTTTTGGGGRRTAWKLPETTSGLEVACGRGVMVAELIGPPARPGRLIGPERLAGKLIQGVEDTAVGLLDRVIGLIDFLEVDGDPPVERRPGSSFLLGFSCSRGRSSDPRFLVEDPVMAIGEQLGDLASCTSWPLPWELPLFPAPKA